VSSNIKDAHTYESIYICMHTHMYVNIHICTQPAASVFADVYVGVKTHLCSVHTCPCTSAQTTCPKVHVTLTAKGDCPKRGYIFAIFVGFSLILIHQHGPRHPNILASQYLCWLFQRSAFSQHNPTYHSHQCFTTHPDFPAPVLVMS